MDAARADPAVRGEARDGRQRRRTDVLLAEKLPTRRCARRGRRTLPDFARPSQVISSANCSDSSSGCERISEAVSARTHDVSSDACSDSTVHRKRRRDPVPPECCSWKLAAAPRATPPSIASPPSVAAAECGSPAAPPMDTLGRRHGDPLTAGRICGENGKLQRDHRFTRQAGNLTTEILVQLGFKKGLLT